MKRKTSQKTEKNMKSRVKKQIRNISEILIELYEHVICLEDKEIM